MTQLAPGALLPYLWSGFCLGLCKSKAGTKNDSLIGQLCPLNRNRKIPSLVGAIPKDLRTKLVIVFVHCNALEIKGFLGRLNGFLPSPHFVNIYARS